MRVVRATRTRIVGLRGKGGWRRTDTFPRMNVHQLHIAWSFANCKIRVRMFRVDSGRKRKVPDSAGVIFESYLPGEEIVVLGVPLTLCDEVRVEIESMSRADVEVENMRVWFTGEGR